MKKIFGILFLALSCNAFAQNKSDQQSARKEKVESMRIAFITQKLNLTTEDAQKFWPIYNEFNKKREELNTNKRNELKGLRGNVDSLSDKQVESLVNQEIAYKQKSIDLQKEYYSKFKSVLSIKKIAKLYRAEDMFARHLLEQLSKRGKEGTPHERRRSTVESNE